MRDSGSPLAISAIGDKMTLLALEREGVLVSSASAYMPQRPKNCTFVVYLVKDTITTPAGAVSSVADLQRHDIEISGVPAILFVKPSSENPPRWVSLFKGILDLGTLKNRSTAAVLVLPVVGRQFAITFGYGKSLLAHGAIEEGFGLRTALGLIKPDSIRNIDKRTFDAIAQLTKQQAAKASSVVEFGLDVERDMMQAVSGVPSDAALGTRVYGKDSLVITVSRELADLPALLAQLLETYQRKHYRQHFDFIDQIDEIGDKTLRAELDEVLVQRLQSNELDKLWIAVPEIVDWTDFGGFKYSPSADAPTFEDLRMPDFFDSLRDPSRLNVKTLHQRHVIMSSQTTDHVIAEWQVYRCIYFELTRDKETFLLSDGKWYRVNADFLSEIRTKFRAVRESTVPLPIYEDDSEQLYNERVATTNANFALMDRRLVRFGGRRDVEFCDLYSRNRQMIHVKRYGGSAVFSHLFAQGAVAAQLFYMERGFREQVNGLLPDTHKIPRPAERPSPANYEVVYAIISNTDGPLEVPFFSMISLVHAVQLIQGLGYPVGVQKVEATTDGDVK